jgi:hypothetical protein
MKDFLEDFFCGSFSGVASCLSGFSLDTIKVHMQINPHLSILENGTFIKCTMQVQQTLNRHSQTDPP